MNYKLIRRSVGQLDQLEKDVNVLTELGWKPVGELKQAQCDGTTIFIQQMEYIRNQPKRMFEMEDQPKK